MSAIARATPGTRRRRPRISASCPPNASRRTAGSRTTASCASVGETGKPPSARSTSPRTTASTRSLARSLRAPGASLWRFAGPARGDGVGPAFAARPVRPGLRGKWRSGSSMLSHDWVLTGSAVVRGDDVVDRCDYGEVSIDVVAHDGDGDARVDVGVRRGAVGGDHSEGRTRTRLCATEARGAVAERPGSGEAHHLIDAGERRCSDRLQALDLKSTRL